MSETTSTRSTPSAVAPGQWEEFRVRLETLRTNCLKERADSPLDAAGYGADPVEWARRTMLKFNLDDIAAALARIKVGSYGICERCGEPIPRGRLELRPIATTCVPCADRR